MLLGWVEFVALSLLSLWAAASLAVRLEPAGLAERATAVGIGWVALVTLPVLALGWNDVLYRSTLAASVTFLSVAASLLASRGRGLRAHARATLRLFADLAAAPRRALVEAWQAKSLVVLLYLASAGCVLWTAWLSWLGASSGWDGIWYHDTIVGFAIQNHGFSIEPLPKGMEYVNCFPRACEALNLWFVFFTDRRLIELPNTVMSPLLIVASYAIVRRYVDERVLALGWACVLFLIPGVLLELRSTYIDLHIAALYLAAACFCARPEFRLRDAWYAGVALALLAGSKGHALTWVPPLAAFAGFRLVRRHILTRPLESILTLAGTLCLIVFVGAPPYVRNYIVFHNPIWPLYFKSDLLGLDFRGNFDGLAELKWTYASVLQKMLEQPLPGADYPDTRYQGYGALPWLVLPLGALALPWALARSVIRFRSSEAASARNLLACTLPLLITAPFSPALWSARYNVHVAAAVIFLAAWLTAAPRLRRLAEGIVAAAGVASLISCYWADPGWAIGRAQACDLFRMNAAERAAARTIHWAGEPEVILKRDQELGPGDTVAFTDNYSFPSVLWNERFSNRVVYASSFPVELFFTNLDKERAKWVAVAEGTKEYKAISEHPAAWQAVGTIVTVYPKIVTFRRVSR